MKNQEQENNEENKEGTGGGFMAIVSFAVAVYLLYLGISILV